MKKLTALFLALVMTLSLVACGNSSGKIQDALQGSWVAEWTAYGKNISRYYSFKGDQYTTGGVAIFGAIDTKTGRYIIKNSSIHLIPDDGSEESDLDYAYNKSTGTLTLWWNDDIQFAKGKVDVNYY